MNEFLVLLLSLSISSSLIGLLIFVLKPLYRNRLSKTWQYYIWLVVVARLLLPFSPETNLMGYLFQRAEQPAESIVLPETRQDVQLNIPAYTLPNEVVETLETLDTVKTGSGVNPTFQLKAALEQNLFTIWLVVALVLFVRKLTSYLSFVRYIRAGSHEIEQTEILDTYFAVCEETGISKPIPIYENKLASSPMLVGMTRPCIVLPELHLDTESMRLILRHELIHHKRRDILYKWLVQLVLCVYWFNPLICLVSREVNLNCELSCDEAVIGQMTDTDKRRYGDTLLATLKAGGVYGNAVASITLTEDGKTLKERLQAILKHHSGSKWTKIAAVALSVILLCGASFAGAYAGAKHSYDVPESNFKPTLQAVAEQSVEQKAAAPIIMKQDEYTQIMTVSRGETRSVSFQANGNCTALLAGLNIGQEGFGAFTLKVRDWSGHTVVDFTASIYDIGNPTILDTNKNAVYSVEVTVSENGPEEVEVLGAGVAKADYVGFKPFNIEKQASTFGEHLAQEITDRTLDFTFGNIEKWAEQFPERWGNSFSGNNNESWRYLKYLYEDGYLVGVGIRNNESRANYLLETITLDGKTYKLAYSAAVAEYANNAKVNGLIAKILTDYIRQNSSSAQDNSCFIIRSVTYNTDPQDLLRSLYKDKAFVEFMEVVRYCKGLPVIEELLNKAADDKEGMYFMFLAEQLPENFSIDKAETLARKAVDNQDIVMLSALERFLSKNLYESLMQEALGLDDFNFNFDFGLNKK